MNWELLFRGTKGNAHATIKRKKGASVSVLVWNIQPEDENRLDFYEGYPKYYFKKAIMVEIQGKKKKAMVYIMDESHSPGRPSAQYIRTICQGYQDNSFDAEILAGFLRANTIECIRL